MPNEPHWRVALRSLCLKKINDFGGRGTARRIADDLGKDIGLISPRMDELAEMGVIRDTGQRIRQGRGRPLTLWEAVDPTQTTTARPDAPDEDCDAPSWFKRFGQ